MSRCSRLAPIWIRGKPSRLRPGLPDALPRRLVFSQGDEMGRPGRIEVEVRREADGAVRGWIGGNAITILRGELAL